MMPSDVVAVGKTLLVAQIAPVASIRRIDSKGMITTFILPSGRRG